MRSASEQARAGGSGCGRSGWVLISELWAHVWVCAGAGGGAGAAGGARSRAISVRVRRRMPTTSKNIRRASAFHTERRRPRTTSTTPSWLTLCVRGVCAP